MPGVFTVLSGFRACAAFSASAFGIGQHRCRVGWLQRVPDRGENRQAGEIGKVAVGQQARAKAAADDVVVDKTTEAFSSRNGRSFRSTITATLRSNGWPDGGGLHWEVGAFEGRQVSWQDAVTKFRMGVEVWM